MYYTTTKKEVDPSSYVNSFLRSSDQHRWSREEVAFPRAREIFRANTDREIERGFCVLTRRKDSKYEHDEQIPLSNFHKRNNSNRAYGVFRHNVLASEDGKNKKYWLFTTYAEDRLVDWIQFDVDRHDIDTETQIEFWAQVEAIQAMAQENEFDVIWTTSPGNILDGQHVQGLNAWIRLSKPMQVGRLRQVLPALKYYYGIDAEASWDTRNRNIRIPGQAYMDLVKLDIENSIYSINQAEGETERKRNDDRLGQFILAWESARKTDSKKIFEAPLEYDQSVKTKKQAAPRTPNIPQPSATHLRDTEHNTFNALIDSKLPSIMATKYRGNLRCLDLAVLEIKNKFRAMRPGTSKTCSSDLRLTSFLRRILHWFFTHWDASKSSIRQRDRQRFSHCSRIDIELVARYLKRRCGLFYKEEKSLRRILPILKKYNGRIYCKVLYALSGSQRRWFTLLEKINKYFVVVDEYVKKIKCRQWALSKVVVDDLMKKKEDEEKKVETYSDTHPPASTSSSDIIITPDFSTSSLCQSDGFLEENNKIPIPFA